MSDATCVLSDDRYVARVALARATDIRSNVVVHYRCQCHSRMMAVRGSSLANGIMCTLFDIDRCVTGSGGRGLPRRQEIAPPQGLSGPINKTNQLDPAFDFGGVFGSERWQHLRSLLLSLDSF